jgi:hypothetical protein
MPAQLIDATPNVYGNVVFLRWGDFRSLFVANNAPIFYAYDTNKYTVFSQIGPILFACELVVSTQSPNIQWPSSYPQSQNDVDVAEFTGQWLDKANLPIQGISETAKMLDQLTRIASTLKKIEKLLKKNRRAIQAL